MVRSGARAHAPPPPPRAAAAAAAARLRLLSRVDRCGRTAHSVRPSLSAARWWGRFGAGGGWWRARSRCPPAPRAAPRPTSAPGAGGSALSLRAPPAAAAAAAAAPCSVCARPGVRPARRAAPPPPPPPFSRASLLPPRHTHTSSTPRRTGPTSSTSEEGRQAAEEAARAGGRARRCSGRGRRRRGRRRRRAVGTRRHSRGTSCRRAHHRRQGARGEGEACKREPPFFSPSAPRQRALPLRGLTAQRASRAPRAHGPARALYYGAPCTRARVPSRALVCPHARNARALARSLARSRHADCGPHLARRDRRVTSYMNDTHVLDVATLTWCVC